MMIPCIENELQRLSVELDVSAAAGEICCLAPGVPNHQTEPGGFAPLTIVTLAPVSTSHCMRFPFTVSGNNTPVSRTSHAKLADARRMRIFGPLANTARTFFRSSRGSVLSISAQVQFQPHALVIVRTRPILGIDDAQKKDE